ncbi:unnamed protein product [Lampetra fluviatilis]
MGSRSKIKFVCLAPVSTSHNTILVEDRHGRVEHTPLHSPSPFVNPQLDEDFTTASVRSDCGEQSTHQSSELSLPSVQAVPLHQLRGRGSERRFEGHPSPVTKGNAAPSPPPPPHPHPVPRAPQLYSEPIGNLSSSFGVEEEEEARAEKQQQRRQQQQEEKQQQERDRGDEALRWPLDKSSR